MSCCHSPFVRDIFFLDPLSGLILDSHCFFDKLMPIVMKDHNSHSHLFVCLFVCLWFIDYIFVFVFVELLID